MKETTREIKRDTECERDFDITKEKTGGIF